MPDDNDGQMMAIPLGQLIQQQPRKPQKPPMELVQVMELVHAFAQSEKEYLIKEGELYVEKDGVGIFNDDEPKHRVVLIVWRLLSEAAPLDFYIARETVKNTRGSIPDCIVARKFEGTLMMLPYESWRLEPYTGPRE